MQEQVQSWGGGEIDQPTGSTQKPQGTGCIGVFGGTEESELLALGDCQHWVRRNEVLPQLPGLS